jgi:hypothetical protein
MAMRSLTRHSHKWRGRPALRHPFETGWGSPVSAKMANQKVPAQRPGFQAQAVEDPDPFTVRLAAAQPGCRVKR